MWFLFSSRRVTTNVLAASLCAYLLLGVFFSEIYSIMELLHPGSFKVATSDVSFSTRELGGQANAYAFYYSLVTMTTLGYGDIVPMTLEARIFAAFQAVMGQLYIAVLVARLVALHVVHSSRDRDGDQRV